MGGGNIVCVCVCVSACVRVCVSACMRACVRASVCARHPVSECSACRCIPCYSLIKR